MSATVNMGVSTSMGANISARASASAHKIMDTGMNSPRKFQHTSRASLLVSLALHAVGLVSLSSFNLRPPPASFPSPMAITLHTSTAATTAVVEESPVTTKIITLRAAPAAIPSSMPSRDSFVPAKAVEEMVNENRNEDRDDDGFYAQPSPPAAHTGAAEPMTTYSARPDYDYNPPPDYPLILREQGISGVVWLRVWVDSEGRPTEIKLAKGSGYRLLDDSALRAVKKWRFIPAKLGRQKLASWVEFPIRFTLAS